MKPKLLILIIAMLLLVLPSTLAIVSDFGEGTYGSQASDAWQHARFTVNASFQVESFNVTWTSAFNAEGSRAVAYNDKGGLTPLCNATISNDKFNCNISVSQQELGGHIYIIYPSPYVAFTKVYSTSLPHTIPHYNNSMTYDGFGERAPGSENASGFPFIINATLTTGQSFGIYLVSWTNKTPATVDTTIPRINVSTNTTIPKIKGVVNISANVSDETGLTLGIITHNMTGSKSNFSFTLSGTDAKFSQNITINLSRGNVINFTALVNDSSGNTNQSEFIITVSNTAPTQPIIINTSNGFFNLNQTFNITPVTDADSDTVTYSWFYNTTTGNYVFIQAGTTLTSWTTNVTDGTYGILVNASDGITNTSSAYFNFTIDSTPITIPTDTITQYNNSYIKGNLTLNIEGQGNNIFNSSLNISQDGITYGLWINDSPNNNRLGFNTNINLSLLSDGSYNITFEAVESHSEPIDKNIMKKGKKGEAELIFNDTFRNKIITMGISFVEKDNKPTDTPANLKSFSEYNDEDYIIFGTNFTASKPETKIKFTINTTVGDIKILNTTYKGHGISIPYGWDFEGKLYINGIERDYTVETARISRNEIEVLIIPVTPLAGNDVVIFISQSLFGISQIIRFNTLNVDNTLPVLNDFNLSNIINATFTNKQYFNITVNATESNPNSVQIYLNNIINSSGIYTSNTATNVSFTIATDGNYTINVTVNDSAGNKISSTYFYNIVVDTTLPTFTEAVNRTTTNSTNILDNTDVNLSVFGFGDIYSNGGNFSENCTSSSNAWKNHTSFNQGNGTYHNIIESTNLTAGEVCGWKFYAFDKAGNLLDPIYTFTVGSSATPPEESTGDTGGSGSFTSGAEAGTTTFASQATLLNKDLCEQSKDMVWFEETCYNCDGIIIKEGEDILCRACNEGYHFEGTECVIDNEEKHINILDKYLNKLFPDNPILGFVILLVSIIILLIIVINRKIIIKNVKNLKKVRL